MRLARFFLAFGAILPGAAVLSAAALPVTSYLSFADSPFNGGTFNYFCLEDFEDGVLNTPGVTASAGVPLGPASLTDSVDGDDGVIDGSGTAGHSWYSSNTSAVRFTFSAVTLGAFPTVVGIVWTDVGFLISGGIGVGDVEMEAFDSGGASLGVISASSLGDGSANGGTAEDRFFGWTNASGISAIELRMPNSTDWEMDHLQYGYSAVPEPSTWAFGLTGLAALAVRKLRTR